MQVRQYQFPQSKFAQSKFAIYELIELRTHSASSPTTNYKLIELLMSL